MKLDYGLEMLELSANVMGGTDIIYATIIYDDNNIILVDTGYPGQLQKICDEMNKAGLPFDKLNKIIITNHDIDHIGSLQSILNELPHKVEVMAHSEEKPYIQGEKGIYKVTAEDLARVEASPLPEKQRKAIIATLQNSPQAEVNKTLSDGEELPYCGGITVIHTPGHTHGHICLYLKQSKTLITGDAMNIVEGQLVGPNPQLSFDIKSAKSSLKKLTQYDIQTVICYHGGVYQNNPNKRIAELASN